MQEQDWEKLKEAIGDAAEEPVPDTLMPEAVQAWLEQKKHRKTKRHLTGVAAAAAVAVVFAGSTYALRHEGAKQEIVQTTTQQETTRSEEETAVRTPRKTIGTFTQAKNYKQIRRAVAAYDKEVAFAEAVADGADEVERKQAAVYSTTNVQVEGIDEGDVVKTDGAYLYVGKDDAVTILSLDGNLEKTAVIEPDLTESEILVNEIYVDGDRLYLFVQGWNEELATQTKTDTGSVEDVAYAVQEQGYTKLLTYDISDRGNPLFTSVQTVDGTYSTSRRVGDFIYLFTARSQMELAGNAIPQINGTPIAADRFYVQKNSGCETVMVAVDTRQAAVTDSMVLLSNGQQVYMGEQAVYLYGTDNTGSHTQLVKFSYTDGRFFAEAATRVRGRITDTFAISEQDTMLRVLTSDTENRLYLLDEALHETGSLKHIAKGEQVYAARYIGTVAYFITYRNTDPLYAVDLSDPHNPKKLGYVKMTGYADYLHPFGEGLLLGIGYETDAKTGETTGVKLTMFDISDPTHLAIKDAVVVKGEYCPVVDDYKTVFVEPDLALVGFSAVRWSGTGDMGQYVLYHWNGTAFEQVLSHKLLEQDWAVGDSGRGLYVGNRFYILQCEPFRVTAYDMEDAYRKICTKNY